MAAHSQYYFEHCADYSGKPMDMNSAETGEGAFIRMFALNVGGTNNSDTGLAGYLDNVVMNLGTGTTVYDFEASPVLKDDCKKGGYTDYGFRNQGLCIQFVNTGKDSRNRN